MSLRTFVLALLLLALSAPGAHAQQARIRGQVVEAGAGTPIEGVVIRDEVSGHHVVSSADGTWQMDVDTDSVVLTLEHLAFAAEQVPMSATDDALIVVRLTRRPVALNELVVTAARRAQQLKDVPVATEVLARSEIRQTGAADLSAVLVTRTGIAEEGGHPVGSGIMLQGLGSERVLVLVDGQPLGGRISGSLDLSRIPAALVERVEIVKGPQSTVYGSEAMGGVINVITRSPRAGAQDGALRVTAGSNDRLDISGSAAGGVGALALTADAGRRMIELVPGHDGAAGTFAERWDGAARAALRVSPGLDVSGGMTLLDESQRWRTGQLYNFVDNLQWTARAGAAMTRGAHSFSPSVYVTEFRHTSRRSTLPSPVGSGEREQQRLMEAELLYNHMSTRTALDAGVEVRRETIHSDRVEGQDRALNTAEPFAQLTWSGDAWSIVPGVRMTWSEQWGAHFTPRLAALVRPVEQLALRASAGQGFRAPSFKELYMEFLNTGAGTGYRVRGNPDLRPEASSNVSGSVEWTGERIYSRIQGFYNRFDDFIETRAVPDGGDITLYEYGNIDEGETYGADVEVGAAWRAFRAEAGFGLLRARDRSTGRTLLGRPSRSARASLSYAASFGLNTSIAANHSGMTPVSRDDDGNELMRDPLTTVDVRLTQSLPRGFTLSAGVRNALDATVSEYPGYLGRQLYLGLEWAARPSQ